MLKTRNKKHNPNSPQISDHLYSILIIGGCVSGKTNSLLNLVNHQPDIDKTVYIQRIYMKENISF